MKPDDPAFPSHGSMGEVVQHGMSLRAYFAVMVMQSLIHRFSREYAEVAAKNAVAYADALIAELNKDRT